MHRAYQPITPANNKLLKKKWDMIRFEIHRDKVKQAKAVLDNDPPRTYVHLHLKLKKLQVEETRLSRVERDNRILLEKMSQIMRSDKSHLDNKNDYEDKSLNKTKRQRELLRITHENQAILKRILSKEPHYSHQRWEEDWKVNMIYRANIAKYPIKPHCNTKTRKKTESSEKKSGNELPQITNDKENGKSNAKDAERKTDSQS
ncbi:sperm axonemal maintenance protein CFAP97D1-like [Lineus longissimus]|uniref:sperm axonemal maintenance protein CFAP97D1-like n=1 Tax=Lineus longissimus TaxID=88925 RepID=UPI00315CA935